MPSDGKRSHCLWQGELKRGNDIQEANMNAQIALNTFQLELEDIGMNT
jgi:hypothetical protein